MKKLVLLLFALTSMNVFAQLTNGSIAPNWTLTDLNGNVHTLYDYLDQGKSVVIDISATWCGPCWNYHGTHALKTIYDSYGPAGTNDMMVFFVEGDAATTLADLQGTTSASQGDWVTGTPYPIFNPTGTECSTFNDNYGIAYFPTVYLICPDRIITEVGSVAATTIRAAATGCPALSTTTNDAKILSITKPTGQYCTTSVLPQIKIQNYGSAPLTSVTATMTLNGVAQTPYNWTGNVAQYQGATISMPVMSSLADGNYNYSIALSNPNGATDDNAANNSLTKSFGINSNGANVSIDVLSDTYPGEISWVLSQNTTELATSSLYTAASAHTIESVCLTPGQCYTIVVNDAYGDGFPGGNITIKLGSTVITTILGNSLTDTKSVDFCVNGVGMEDNALNQINVYPNPTNGILTISNVNNAKIKVMNALGQIVITENGASVDMSNLQNGTYFVQIIENENVITKKVILNK
ncbi:MAG: T9SS type A sorting domain-containing protein [Bacteroidota bacterium]